MNVDRLLVGFATTFDQPGRDGTAAWSASAFEDFLRLETAIPLRVDHGPLINNRGVIADVGMARLFAPVEFPLPGLLMLGEISDADGFGDSLLRDIERMLGQQWLPAGWSLSIGANVLDGIVMPFELSLTRNPAFADAAVLAVGPQALSTWSLLTEMKTPANVAMAV